ncbi:unnamed protein product [Rhizophagus irregularis]|nr:unnamed protein product [Rhizophagus irregularis]
MNRQTFFLSPKFNKKLIYNLQTNKYQEFTNAYVYSIMVKTGNGDPNRAELCESATKEWNNIKRKDKPEIDDIIRGYLAKPYNLCDIQTVRSKSSRSREESLQNLPTFHTVDPVQEISVNASAQKKAANEIQIAEKKLTEFEQIYNITTDSQFRLNTYKKIGDLQDEIRSNKERIIKLKRNASYSQRCREKKRKILNENQEVIQYDKPGRPSLLFEHPNLHDHIHDSIKFGAADEKRRREVVKVRIIENLRKTLEENYHIYMARTTLNNYLLPRQSNSIAARAHHHPVWVAVAGVSRTETRDHPDGHYCLASVKSARQFATVFADKAVIISQDDKAKIGLGVPAVGRTFRTLQSVHEPVGVADHDFPLGSGQKLVPSVYLMMKPNESNDELRTGQLAIFVRRQWSLGTSSLSHMQDLKNLALDPKYSDVLKTNGKVRPIWVLLVDGDYLTVRTHAPDQSKYNPVERGMATLSGKLAGITLPVDHFGSHLNTQGKVIDLELALQNFRYAGESLCDIWRKDLIFGKSVDARYVEQLTDPFENLEFEGTVKEKEEERKQQKKKQENENDIPECFVPYCCGPSRAKEATELLLLNNGFLPPITKAKDGHFTNPIHLLEYYDLLKIPGYDSHCRRLIKQPIRAFVAQCATNTFQLLLI